MDARSVLRSLAVAGVLCMSAAQAMAADYALTFQGVSFQTTALNSSQLQFTILNATHATGDWTGIQYVEAFDFQSIASATDVDPNTTITPMQFALVDAGLTHNGCSTGDPTGSACFSAATPVALTDSMSWVIDFKNTAGLNFVKPDLKIDFYTTSGQSGATGSVLSQQLQPVAVTSSVPEPETAGMLFAGLGLVGVFTRRKKPAVA